MLYLHNWLPWQPVSVISWKIEFRTEFQTAMQVSTNYLKLCQNSLSISSTASMNATSASNSYWNWYRVVYFHKWHNKYVTCCVGYGQGNSPSQPLHRQHSQASSPFRKVHGSYHWVSVSQFLIQVGKVLCQSSFWSFGWQWAGQQAPGENREKSDYDDQVANVAGKNPQW